MKSETGGDASGHQATGQDEFASAGLAASPAPGRGFILKHEVLVKDNVTSSKNERKDVPVDSVMCNELSAADLQIGWYGYDGVIDASDECSPKTGASDDPELWKPIPLTEDCPICFIPLPLDRGQTFYLSCCGAMSCHAYIEESNRAILSTANAARAEEKVLQPPKETCPFCRSLMPQNSYDETDLARNESRVQKGDAEAMMVLAHQYRYGNGFLPKDECKALTLPSCRNLPLCICSGGTWQHLYAW